MNIDLFERITDQHGHAAGDAVLKRFASFAVDVLREADSVSRRCGEEFLVMIR